VVFEDLDGNGVQDIFSGELGIEGWTVDLRWNGEVIATMMAGADGSFVFGNLGNTGRLMFEECLGAPPLSWSAGRVTQTLPVGGSACSGAGYAFPFNNPFMTWSVNNFGEQLVP